jgi:hypothetical protein
MSFDFLSNFFNFRRIGGVNAQATKILQDTELNDEEKLKSLLRLEFLRSALNSVNDDGNEELQQFLQRSEIMDKLIKYSLAVPQDPENSDESYK